MSVFHTSTESVPKKAVSRLARFLRNMQAASVGEQEVKVSLYLYYTSQYTSDLLASLDYILPDNSRFFVVQTSTAMALLTVPMMPTMSYVDTQRALFQIEPTTCFYQRLR